MRLWAFVLAGLALAAGLILTYISGTELCTIACTEGHKYRLYGFRFELFGYLFFIPALALHLLQRRWTVLYLPTALLVASALGAELWFTYTQKFIIGQWCPVCLVIAAAVAVAAAAYLADFLTKEKNEAIMKTLWKGSPSLAALIIGFMIAFLGLFKPDPLVAAEASLKERITFGNKESPIEVYIFTDWFCPACRMVSPRLNKMVPEIEKEAKVYFIDAQVNPESLNFTPYNLAFMVYNKPQYLDVREELEKLSEQNQAPDDADIEQLVDPMGIRLKELHYSDVMVGTKLFRKLVKDFSVTSTPTIVVVNVDTKKGKKLSGTVEITEPNVMRAIKTLKKE